MDPPTKAYLSPTRSRRSATARSAPRLGGGMAIQALIDFLLGERSFASATDAQSVYKCEEIVKLRIAARCARYAGVQWLDRSSLHSALRVGPDRR